jgi:hypothetical protein
MAMAIEQAASDWTGRALKASGAALATTVWISAAIFGAYIVAAYGGALQDGALERWNSVLPKLYEPGSPLAAMGIGAHFAAGAVLLLLGPIQLIGAVRRNIPGFHRAVGRIYVLSAFVAGAGGLAHIFVKGAIGGPTMDVGFALYGALMILCAVQTLRFGMARRFDVHRAWAIRLFALAIGSWLYRVYYGLWDAFTGNIGHTKTFDGWFDVVNIFLFYVPNLLVAELFIRARLDRAKPALRAGASLVLFAAAGLVAYGTWFFTLDAWGPPILARLR